MRGCFNFEFMRPSHESIREYKTLTSNTPKMAIYRFHHESVIQKKPSDTIKGEMTNSHPTHDL